VNKHILLIDDSDAANQINKYHFNKAGFVDIAIAKNGQEALKHLKSNLNHLPELIMLDISMPVMNGFEFLEELRKSFPIKAKVPKILMLTSSESHIDLAKAKKNDLVTEYVNKPINHSKIIKKYFG